MTRPTNRLADFCRDESGATAVEYGIMIAAIAAVIVATVFSIGGEVRDSLFSNIDTLLDTLPN